MRYCAKFEANWTTSFLLRRAWPKLDGFCVLYSGSIFHHAIPPRLHYNIPSDCLKKVQSSIHVTCHSFFQKFKFSTMSTRRRKRSGQFASTRDENTPMDCQPTLGSPVGRTVSHWPVILQYTHNSVDNTYVNSYPVYTPFYITLCIA